MRVPTHDPNSLNTSNRPHRPVLGVSLKLVSILLFAGMTASVKHLGNGVPMGETIFVRSLIAVITLALLARFTVGTQVLRTDNWQRHALRSLAGTASMFCMFASLTMIPLAEAVTLNYSSPLFVTVLAMVFLGERIHAYRWTALAIGFAGVLIMSVPQMDLQHGHPLGLALAFGAAVFAALAMIFLRSMSGGEHAITITFYFLLTSMLASLITLPWGWIEPNREQALFMLLTGLFGVAGQFLMTLSYRYAEASAIAPLDYTAMVVAMIIGYFVFGEVPQWSTFAGAPLVIAAGLLIFWREYRLQLQRAATKPV